MAWPQSCTASLLALGLLIGWAPLAASAEEADFMPFLIDRAEAILETRFADQAKGWVAEALASAMPPAEPGLVGALPDASDGAADGAPGGVTDIHRAMGVWAARREAIQGTIRNKLSAALPDMVREVVTEGMLRGHGGDLKEMQALTQGIGTRLKGELGDRLDQMAQRLYEEAMISINPCLRPRTTMDECRLPAAIDLTDLKGTIDRVLHPDQLLALVSRPLAEAIGESTVREIRGRIDTALRGDLPPEVHDYLTTGINHFKDTADRVSDYLPGAQLDRWKGKLMGTTIVRLPNAVYGAVLTGAAIRHFAKVFCGPGCFNAYELQRGMEVTQVLVWQLSNREEIDLNVGRFLEMVQYVGNQFDIPDPSKWGALGKDWQRIKGQVAKINDRIHQVDEWYAKGVKQATGGLERIVAEFEGELKDLQATLLTPVAEAIAMTNEGFAILRDKANGALPDGFNGIPAAWKGGPWKQTVQKIIACINDPVACMDRCRASEAMVKSYVESRSSCAPGGAKPYHSSGTPADILGPGNDDKVPVTVVAERRLMTPTEGEQIIAAARKWLGHPYLWGGNAVPPEEGIDCSHFVHQILIAMGPGHDYPYHYTGAMWDRQFQERYGFVKVDTPQVGDLVLFPGHVGFYDPNPPKENRHLLSAAGHKEKKDGQYYNSDPSRYKVKHDDFQADNYKAFGRPIYLRRVVPEFRKMTPAEFRTQFGRDPYDRTARCVDGVRSVGCIPHYY